MLEYSEDEVVKTVRPTIKTSSKWKVVDATYHAEECPNIQALIGQTQTDRNGVGSSFCKKGWSIAGGKEIRQNDDSRRVQKAVP